MKFKPFLHFRFFLASVLGVAVVTFFELGFISLESGVVVDISLVAFCVFLVNSFVS